MSSDRRPSIKTNMCYRLKGAQYATIPQAAVFSSSLTPSAFRLFALLVYFRTPFMSYAWIEQHTGMSSKTIRRALTQLEDYGMVKHKRGHAAKSNVYYVAHPSKWTLPESSVQPDPEMMQFIAPEDGTDPAEDEDEAREPEERGDDA